MSSSISALFPLSELRHPPNIVKCPLSSLSPTSALLEARNVMLRTDTHDTIQETAQEHHSQNEFAWLGPDSLGEVEETTWVRSFSA
jgi:hypothetical protein